MNRLDDFIKESGTRLFGSSFETVWIILIIGLAIWTAFDAKKRGKSWFLVMLMILFMNSLGLVIWFVFRPDKVHNDEI